MTQILENRVLLICPHFYGYHIKIGASLKEKGWEVYYKNEVPFNSANLYFYVINILPFLKGFLWTLYSYRLLKLVNKYHIREALIIRGLCLPETLVAKLSNKCNVRITNYQWDSIRNNPNALILDKYSRESYSFDMQDCKCYGFKYLPLFYDWSDVSIKDGDKSDVLFIGSWGEHRLLMANSLSKICDSAGLKCYIYIYAPFFSFLKKLIKGKKCWVKGLHFNTMPRKRYAHLLANTKAVIDMPSPTQIGSTMRTIEALSMGKKLLTTNRNVVNESFYNKSNIFVLENNCVDELMIRNVLATSYDDTSNKSLNTMSSWLSQMGY